MKVLVLASGSKGNCTYIEHQNSKILIDVGVPLSYINKKLSKLDVNINQLDAVLLTHTHIDHVYGLPCLSKTASLSIYIAPGMEKEVSQLTDHYTIINNNEVTIGDFKIETIPTSHDISASVGFIIKINQQEIVYITDTGYINAKYFSQITNKDMYIIESNHDIEMLMTGSYPYPLKQRILSDNGHLSNSDCAMYLSKLIGSNTKCIILAHLSEENNTPEIAYQTLLDSLTKANKKVEKILIAKQHEETELVEI